LPVKPVALESLNETDGWCNLWIRHMVTVALS